MGRVRVLVVWEQGGNGNICLENVSIRILLYLYLQFLGDGVCMSSHKRLMLYLVELLNDFLHFACNTQYIVKLY